MVVAKWSSYSGCDIHSDLHTVDVTQLLSSHSGRHLIVVTKSFCQAVGQADVKLKSERLFCLVSTKNVYTALCVELT